MNRSERVTMFFMWGKLLDRNALCCYFTEKKCCFWEVWLEWFSSLDRKKPSVSIHQYFSDSWAFGHKMSEHQQNYSSSRYLSPLLKEKPKKYFCLIWDINLKYTRETISPLKQKIWSFIFLSFQKEGLGVMETFCQYRVLQFCIMYQKLCIICKLLTFSDSKT